MQNELKIIFSNDDFIAVNKPAGLPVHGGPKVEGPALTDFLIKEFPELTRVGDEPDVRPGLVHRLDKDTSGVMVVARNQKAFEGLKDLFKTRRVNKTYLTLVCGNPKENSGVIDFPIGRMARNPTRRAAVRPGIKTNIKNAREAVSEYSVLQDFPALSLVEVHPKTGRMHQVRVHMAAIGHPVACDRKYGGKSACCPAGLERFFLHAKSIEFSYPEGKSWRFEAELPEDLVRALELAKSGKS